MDKLLQKLHALASLNKKNTICIKDKNELTDEAKELYLSFLDDVTLLTEKEVDELADHYCYFVSMDPTYGFLDWLLPLRLTKKHNVIMAILDVNPFFIAHVAKKDQTLGMAKKVYKGSGTSLLYFLRENLREIVCPNSPMVDSWNKKIVVPEGFQISDV